MRNDASEVEGLGGIARGALAAATFQKQTLIKSSILRSDLYPVNMAPPIKKRKMNSAAVEEVLFDSSARQEYLSGFHKRKLQRARHAQELAEKKARQEKVEQRRKVGKAGPTLYELFRLTDYVTS